MGSNIVDISTVTNEFLERNTKSDNIHHRDDELNSEKDLDESVYETESESNSNSSSLLEETDEEQENEEYNYEDNTKILTLSKKKNQLNIPKHIIQDAINKTLTKHILGKSSLKKKNPMKKYENLMLMSESDKYQKLATLMSEYNELSDKMKKMGIENKIVPEFKTEHIYMCALSIDILKSNVSKKEEALRKITQTKQGVSIFSLVMSIFGWKDSKNQIADPINKLINDNADIFEDMVNEQYPNGEIIHKQDSWSRIMTTFGPIIGFIIFQKLASHFGSGNNFTDVLSFLTPAKTTTSNQSNDNDSYVPGGNNANPQNESPFNMANLASTVINAGKAFGAFS